MPDPGGVRPPPATFTTTSGGGGDHHRSSKLLFGKYELGRLLGCGAFAKVYYARHAKSGQSVALKVISIPRVLRGGLAPNVKREIAVMRRLRHPHVVRLLEVLASRSRIYFVMEFLKGGELFARISRSGRVQESDARSYFHQLIAAVAFCHARGIFHRDLKPENLLLDDAGRLKVSDFGLSALAPDQLHADGLLHTLCGTPAYVAPEILCKRGYDGAKADIWSCGVILFVLVAGYLPFNDQNLMAMYRKIYKGEYRCPRWASPELKKLLSRLLDTNPQRRITVDGILRDPWFTSGTADDRLANIVRLHDVDYEFKSRKADQILGQEEDRELNAFDIIALSSGFDLSGLFGGGGGKAIFVSGDKAEKVFTMLEEVAAEEGMVVEKVKEKKMAAAVVGQGGGALAAWVELHRLTAELVVVEVVHAEDTKLGWTLWTEKFGQALAGSTSSEEPSLSESDRSDQIVEVDSGSDLAFAQGA